ncbi:TPA: plasmid mobilization relaxosome protein MobC [Streptococcus suis]
MSDMIRKQIFSDMERLNRVEKYDKEDVERIIQHFGMLMNEVGLLEQQMFKLGINMNQIAKQLNRKRGFDMNELNSRLNEFDELSDEIKSLSNKVWEGVFDE